MKGRKKGRSSPSPLILLLFCIAGHATAELDGSKEEHVVGAGLPPLKLVHSFCAMKADEGPCKAIHIRYFFSIKSRKCEVFEYGGCHGNENNFLTLEECQEKCVPKGQYFYNKETKLCEKFKYGGCLGNQNNFRSLEECQKTCEDNCNSLPAAPNEESNTLNSSSPKEEPNQFPIFFEPPAIPSLCLTPMDRGLCRAKELRFFYNFSTGRCRPFSYSGCGGNENNFVSRKSCLRICRKASIGLIKCNSCKSQESEDGNQERYRARERRRDRFNKKIGERRLIRIKKKRKKQPVKALDLEIMPEAMQL
ncbi:hypothetical protein EK904_002402 [Melospiza melodia maxima]|nr:hypothetical protein EK904_002402 [Melospiza melodia maxima]